MLPSFVSGTCYLFTCRTLGAMKTVRGLGLAEEGFGALSPSACSTPTGQPHRWNRWMTGCKAHTWGFIESGEQMIESSINNGLLK